ncbi:PH domain-containing protein [Streptomyces sp. NPDC048416]|uniref:PH domain-containing protein n=1 Tax=Streptomyces sp. NPDC048416 TaxID=3365546 RepID=UPI00371E9D9C
MSAPAPQPPALPVTFRPTVTRAVLLSSAAAMLIAMTVMSLLLETLSGGERGSFILMAALFAGVLLLLSRPKVVADDTGVTVTNLTGGRRLAWAEIVRVNLRQGDPWVFLDLSDGTSLPVLGIQPASGRARAIRHAKALRALAETHGTRTDAPGAAHDNG